MNEEGRDDQKDANRYMYIISTHRQENKRKWEREKEEKRERDNNIAFITKVSMCNNKHWNYKEEEEEEQEKFYDTFW